MAFIIGNEGVCVSQTRRRPFVSQRGRISDLVKQTRFASAAELEMTLTLYLTTYNQHIPQRALNHQTPIQALQKWRAEKPDLFVKRVYEQAGLDRCPRRNAGQFVGPMATGPARTRQDFGLTRRKPYGQGRRSGFSGIKKAVALVLYKYLAMYYIAICFRPSVLAGLASIRMEAGLGRNFPAMRLSQCSISIMQVNTPLAPQADSACWRLRYADAGAGIRSSRP